MKLSHLAFAAIGYTLGARAGQERYEQIVRLGRRVVGSQTVQATAGVVQAQLDRRIQQARGVVAERLGGPQPTATAANRTSPKVSAHRATTGVDGVNGHRR